MMIEMEQNDISSEDQLLDASYETDEILPEAMIFNSRASDIFKKKSEEYEKLLNQKESSSKFFDNKKEDSSEDFEKETVTTKKRCKSKSKKPLKVLPKSNNIPTRRSSSRLHSKPIPEIIGDESEITKLTPRAKRRLDKLQEKTDLDMKKIREENKRILSCIPSEEVELIESVDNPSKKEIILKVRYKSRVSRILAEENEKFATIFTKVADLFNLKASEILLCLGDRNIEMNDTPHSLNIRLFDFIDCIPYKPNEEAETEKGCNRLHIKLQSSDSKSKVDMYIHKLERMQDVMERYAKKRNIPLKDLMFEFDGEKIDGSETSEDLDMDNGCCIDVKVMNTVKAKTPTKRRVVIDVPDPVLECDMLDICVLD